MAGIKKVGTTGSSFGIEITEDNTKEVLEQLDDATQRVLTMIGIKAEKFAKALCPVGTPESTGKKGYRGGTLRNSITFEVTMDDSDGQPVMILGSNVEYAPYVELGTGPNFVPPPEWEQFDAPKGSGMPGVGYVKPRPFIRPAITNHVDLYESMIKRELE